MANSDHLIDIFDNAVAWPAGPERERFLVEACKDAPQLLEQVRSLLRSDADAGSFLEKTEFSSDGPITEQLGDVIGRYKLLQKVGEGGCGVVYMAEQTEPVRRRVALKVIKLGLDTKSVIARFEAERQALALMDHPNIAKVLDAGATHTGRPYFVMELVRGVTITGYCDQHDLSTHDRIDLFSKVCHAVQHAHQKGIIHRDIKPSNILVTFHDGVPVPKVIDFGIAKATTGQRLTDKTLFTALEQFMGTPAYMSPEQAELSGLDIDTRCDIYSLGVLLYELLTGKTPFDAKELIASGLDEMRRTIREKEPVHPSTKLTQELEAVSVSSLSGPSAKTEEEAKTLARRLSRIKETILLLRGDVDWIVMKCLEKDRSRRYQSASDLAADLHRHLHNEPVIARPPTALYRFRKMVRRNKFAFAAAGSVLLALLIGLFLASWQAVRATSAEHRARRNAYALEMNVAFHSLVMNNLSQALDLVNRQRSVEHVKVLQDFEWRYLWQLCQGDEFKTFGDEGASAVAFSPNGGLLAYSGKKIVIRETVSWKVATLLSTPAETLSFAPHTNLLASGNYSGVTLWNTETWQEWRSLRGTMLPSLFSPDGRWLLTGIAGAYRLWDTRTWAPVGDCSGAPKLELNARYAVAFSPDSQFVVTVAGQNQIGSFLRVWRLPALELISEIRFGSGRPGAVAFSDDGKLLATGLWDGRLVIHEVMTGKQILTLKEHTARIAMVAFSPDDKTLATAGTDRTINLWDANTFEHRVRLRGHVREVMSVAFSPDSSTIVSGGYDGTTKLWHNATRHTYPTLDGAGLVAGFIGDGRQLVAAFSNRWCVWTPATGARVEFVTPNSPTIISSGMASGKPYDVKPDEPLGALGRSDGGLEIWHLTTGVRVSGWPAHTVAIGAVGFSQDGKRLATGSVKGEVKIWDFISQKEVGRFEPENARLFSLAFSPDGQTLAACGMSSNAWLCNLSGPVKVRQLPGHTLIVGSIAFSPNGAQLATPSLGSEVRLWDLPACSKNVTLRGHVGGATAAAFSPDGKTLATAGTDMQVKLWNIATGHELAAFTLAVEFPTLSFSPDGRMLAVGDMTGDNRRIQILYAPSPDEIAASETKPDHAQAELEGRK